MSPSEKVLRLASAASPPTARQITVKRPRRVINANRVTCCKLSPGSLDTRGKKNDMQMALVTGTVVPSYLRDF